MQWMGAVRMRVQTADKKNHNNPQDSSPSINLSWSEKLCLYMKQIHHMEVFNLLLPATLGAFYS